MQLNIHKLLDVLFVATQELTRFEDRRRLLLGISVNFNNMAAKLLTQVGGG